VRPGDAPEVLDHAPAPAEFVALRAICGWGEVPEALAARALAASVIDVSARRSGGLLGFGRVVGDGVLYFYVQDVIVAPHTRGEGVGRLVMERLMIWVRAIAPAGATIGLMSAVGKEGFYECFGFTPRPAASYGAGMTQFVCAANPRPQP
jgi:GNAT superfamily N-acetyltransferase